MNRASGESDHSFSGELDRSPEFDIPTLHELRIRVAGMISAKQAEILSPTEYEGIDPTTLSREQLIEGVAYIEHYIEQEQPFVVRERAAAREALWEVMGHIDDMENEALKKDL